ncbi:MAG: YhbY family RNA-binding protein [Gammaproteobacteria bacterium]
MDTAEKKRLKARAHTLKPVVMIGQSGLTEGVLTETELALACHELIKIKIRADREERNAMLANLLSRTGAEFIQKIGHMVVVYKPNPNK